MLSTFIKNKGISKTIIHKDNKNYYNEMNWDADYDGEKANISLDINDNGSKGHIEMKMNNDELAEILNIPSVDKTLDKRLYNDFLTRTSKPIEEDKIIQIHIKPKPILHNNFHAAKDSYHKYKKKVHFHNDDHDKDHDSERNYNNELVESIEEMLNPTHSKQKYTHISSPLSQEELLFPLTMITRSSHKHKTHRHHRKPKTHVTHKIYRKPKTSSLRSSKKRHGRSHNHSYSRRTF